MSKFLADHLPEPLLARLSIDNAIERADRAMIICSVDEHGWPHPAMVSSLELVARDARNVRLAMPAASRTTRNLRNHGRLTIIAADEDTVYYLKGDVLLHTASLNAAPHLSSFNLRVDSVLQDSAAEGEGARLTSGLHISRTAIDLPRARAVLNELLQP